MIVAMGVMAVLWIILDYSMSFVDNVFGGLLGWNKDYLLLNGMDASYHGERGYDFS